MSNSTHTGLTLYHSVESTCAQKVRFVLAEKRLEWEEVLLNLRRGDQFDPVYLKINPKAVVPTLVHDGKVVRESTVIIEYIDDVFPEPPLKPAAMFDRARMRLIDKMFDEEVHPAIGILSYAIVLRHQMNELKSVQELEEHFRNIADPGRRERQRSTHELGLAAPPAKTAMETLYKIMCQLDGDLDHGPWLAGETFSLADATAAPYVVRMQALNLSGLWQDKAKVKDWLARVVDRCNSHNLDQPWGSPSFSQVVARHVDEAKPDILNLLNNIR